MLGVLWTIIPERGKVSPLGALRLDRAPWVGPFKTNEDHPKFQNKIAEHQPLRLDSKPRAWGAVDRHNIPKGLRTLLKDSDTL